MIYQGNAITVERRDTLGGNDIAILTFDLKDESVNKLSSAVMAELGNAVKAIQAESGLKGLILRDNRKRLLQKHQHPGILECLSLVQQLLMMSSQDPTMTRPRKCQ